MNPSRCSAECSGLEPGKIIAFDPEPDLAGIGVIISFMVTLTFTILITWVASIMVEMFCYHNSDEIAKFAVSSISERSRIVREKINTTAKGRRIRRACFVTLIFSDQQLIVGTSLLTSAYVKHCTLTQYHFEIAGLLSLCSFRTFQFAAGILAGTLRSNFSKGWRLFWVTAVAAMMLVTILFRMNRHYMQPFGAPLDCLQLSLRQGSGYGPSAAARLAYTILTEVVLVYCRCMLRLFPIIYSWRPLKSSISGLQRILLLPGKKLLEAKEEENTWKAHCYWMLTFFSIMVRYLISSPNMELGAVSAIFVRVSWLVWDARSQAAAQGRRGTEDEWGFGQILPLFLLALPITTLVESIRSPWAVVSSPAHPQSLEYDPEGGEKSNKKQSSFTTMLMGLELHCNSTNTSTSTSMAAPKREVPLRPAKRIRSLSSPELVVGSQTSNDSLLDRPQITDRTLLTLEAAPALESQINGDVVDSEKEWQNKVERYESEYLNKGMFQLWIFLFNIGIMVFHTIIILPAPYG